MIPRWMQQDPLCKIDIREAPVDRAITLTDLAREIGTHLAVVRYPEGRWTVSLWKVEVKDGAMLTSAYGDSISAQGAADDYAAKLSGKRLVWAAMSARHRREVGPYTVVADSDDDGLQNAAAQSCHMAVAAGQ
jgi:hypothetical protein